VRCSNLGSIKKGGRVNLETALTLSQKLGGHLVTGHIDGIGTLSSISKQQDCYVITVKHDARLNKYIATKGSVAVDGVSLTIAEAGEGFFKVAIISHTFENTIFQYKKAGDSVNIECDIISKYVERLLARGEQVDLKNKPGLDIDYLIKKGF
jgi:riboflavin synthase